MNRLRRPLAAFATLLAMSALFASTARADAKEVVIAYQDHGGAVALRAGNG